MRVLKRMIHVLSAAVLVAFAASGCQPQHTGDGQAPPQPNLDLAAPASTETPPAPAAAAAENPVETEEDAAE